MSAITEALAEHPVTDGSWHHTCEGAKFHSPTPLLVRQVAVAGRYVWLCPTCSDNLEVFLSLMDANEGGLSWPVRREFGNMLRALGDRAWKAH